MIMGLAHRIIIFNITKKLLVQIFNKWHQYFKNYTVKRGYLFEKTKVCIATGHTLSRIEYVKNLKICPLSVFKNCKLRIWKKINQ